MRLSYAHGIFLMVLSSMVNWGGSFKLHFTNEVKKYIDEKNKTEGSITSWGFTEDYAYWKENISEKVPAVTARIAWMIYGDCKPHHHRKSQKNNCTGHFSWSVHDCITSPFSLRWNTSLPIKFRGPEPKNVSLELDNATIFSNVFHWGHTRGEEQTFRTTCEFVARASFTGYLAYNLTNAGKGSSSWVTVNITELATISREFEVRRGELLYYMWGTYYERMTCV
ncbi:uncharacterized protein LOC119372630 [Rhipicephalus sanguineus]|uniref:uncharacterized protein LOC119372630 n=1 Tax=Rhipicephalus sanguineus TaxID=34632 RepID=UPI001895F18A|nr:uncharacterized protein LOC119372630 [Rhipicephalus sanguineus]